MDKKQMDYTIAKDEEWKEREERKNADRRQHALNLLKETEERHKLRQSECANGASRGERMTSEELRFNKGLLREVSKMKKDGNFNDLVQQCTSKKVSKFDD